jgi:hypothetical protein
MVEKESNTYIKQKLVPNPIPTTTSPLEKHIRVPRKKRTYQQFQHNITCSLKKIWNNV